MNIPKLDDLAAKFEYAFRALESDKFSTEEKLKQIDVIADYLFEHSEEDYVDGDINENSPVFFFIEKMIEGTKICRQITFTELEKREEYEFLAKLQEPISDQVEAVIESLNVF